MLLILLQFCLLILSPCLTTITLTTDRDVTMYDGTINVDFLTKENNFDCSAYVYAYAQTSEEYQNN